MKVCLINPPHPYLIDPKAQAPLGLLYLSAALKKGGVPVSTLDLSDKAYSTKIDFPAAKIFGITASILDKQAIASTAKQIKEQYPQSKVIVGGTAWVAEKQLDLTHVDSVVRGEGEKIIFDIINDFPNLQKQYYAERITDLDSIPFPDRDAILNKGGDIFSYHKNYKGDSSVVFVTSRGCPHRCAFCASPGIWKRKIVFRGVQNIVDEIKFIMAKYNIYQFRISDDTLTMRLDRLEELCHHFKKLGIIWRYSIRVKPNDYKMFKMMYDSGCREISPGIETGDQSILDLLQKDSTVEDNRKCVINARKAGITVRMLLMCGLPGETAATIQRNIDFLKSVDYGDSIALTRFVPMPGTEIGENPAKFNCRIIDTNLDNYHLYMYGPEGERAWTSFIETDDMTREQLTANMKTMKDFVISTGKSGQWKK